MTSTGTTIRATADAQIAATTKAGVGEDARDVPFSFVIAGLETATTANGEGQGRGDTVRRVLSVEARVRLTAQDEEFDADLIRDDDLLS